MDSAAELQKLRQQLLEAEKRAGEAERQAKESERQAKESERQAKEAERQAKEAERRAAAALPQDLRAFLQGCHDQYRKIQPVTDFSTATTGPTTNPVARWYPQRIVPWEDFHLRQQQEWERLDEDEDLWTRKVYPSVTNLDFIGRGIDPIASEDELRYVQRVTLESNVKSLFESINFGVGQAPNGRISFENQARFRTEDGDDLAKRTADLAIRDQYARNIRADQYCILRKGDGAARPVVAIEYKAPHKLTIEEISTGLKGEIWPERDVIDKHDDDFEFRCKNLLAAVVTQLFSYMIDREVRFGYISSGQVKIFGQIPADDPASFYYSVNFPRRDCAADRENSLKRTAVAQVFAFTLQALRAGRPGAGWSDCARATLKRWPIEFHDILATIPITERKSREASVYEPSVWLSPEKTRRRYKLRRRCNDSSPEVTSEDSDEDDGLADNDSPSRPVAKRTGQAATRSVKRRTQHHGTRHQHRQTGIVRTTSLESRRYCTQNCLRGLCLGLPVDASCPNAAKHGEQHIPRQKVLELLRDQIDTDRSQDADCLPLWIYGARGALFKVRLSEYGYIMIAKGVERSCDQFIETEHATYRRLKSIQASVIPVCCGIIRLQRSYFFDGVPLHTFLITAFAGESLACMRNRLDISDEYGRQLDDRKALAFQKIRSLGVMHGDEADRNVVYDSTTDSLMVIDFDRSSIITRKPLGQLSPNRKRPAERTLANSKRKTQDHDQLPLCKDSTEH